MSCPASFTARCRVSKITMPPDRGFRGLQSITSRGDSLIARRTPFASRVKVGLCLNLFASLGLIAPLGCLRRASFLRRLGHLRLRHSVEFGRLHHTGTDGCRNSQPHRHHHSRACDRCERHIHVLTLGLFFVCCVCGFFLCLWFVAFCFVFGWLFCVVR